MPRLEEALASLSEAEILDLQLQFAATPAPTFDEGERAALVARLWREARLEVHQDEAGNVLGGVSNGGTGPYLALSAHLDHVFPRGQDLRTRRAGEDCPFCDAIVPDGELHGPGIGDCAAGLAAITAVARVLGSGAIETASPVVLVATVGEEAQGDLKGARALFDGAWGARIGAFVTVDVGVRGAVVHETTCSTKYRVRATGPGGHAWDDAGLFSPVHALAMAAARVAIMELPTNPRSSCNIGLFHAGRSVNAIPEEAEFHVDLRSGDPEMLRALGERLRDAATAGFEEYESIARGSGQLHIDVTGERPGGRIPREHPLVQAAHAALAGEGIEVRHGPGSLDANIPLSRGIPAIGFPWGGSSRQLHSVRETYRPAGRLESVRALLRLVSTFDVEAMDS